MALAVPQLPGRGDLTVVVQSKRIQEGMDGLKGITSTAVNLREGLTRHGARKTPRSWICVQTHPEWMATATTRLM